MLTWFWICLQFIKTWHLNCCWGKPLSVCQPSCELNVRRINCLEVSPTWGDGGSWRVNHFYRREIIYDFHKGESVWFLSHFRIKFIFLQTMCSLCFPVMTVSYKQWKQCTPIHRCLLWNCSLGNAARRKSTNWPWTFASMRCRPITSQSVCGEPTSTSSAEDVI